MYGAGPARDGRAAPRPWEGLSVSTRSDTGARPPSAAAEKLAWAHGGNDGAFCDKANMHGGGVLALDLLLAGDSSVEDDFIGVAKETSCCFMEPCDGIVKDQRAPDMNARRLAESWEGPKGEHGSIWHHEQVPDSS